MASRPSLRLIRLSAIVLLIALLLLIVVGGDAWLAGFEGTVFGLDVPPGPIGVVVASGNGGTGEAVGQLADTVVSAAEPPQVQASEVAIPAADAPEAATPEPTAAPMLLAGVGARLGDQPPGQPTVPQPAPLPAARPTEVPVATGARSLGGAPILMYHYIRVNPNPRDTLGRGLSVSPTDFAAQMSFLVQHGYHAVSVDDIVSGRAKSVAKPIAITFDDGYADAFFEAAPVLRERDLFGTFYLITGFVGRASYLTWDQTRLLSGWGMVIGSHTIDHSDLTRLGFEVLRRELGESRAELERQIGRPVSSFCYPSGRYDTAVRAAVSAAGYRTAVTTRFGVTGPNEDPLALSRIRVSGSTTLAEFARLLGDRLVIASPSRPETLEPAASGIGQAPTTAGMPSPTPERSTNSVLDPKWNLHSIPERNASSIGLAGSR